MQERFKKAKVGLTVESQYDPTRIYRAIAVLKDLLAEHGHQFANVTYVVKTIPPASVGITFNVKEGPTVKVGKIAFQGNNNISDRTLRASMMNTKPIGIPHSIMLENLFARTFDASKLDEDTERVRRAYQDRGYFKAQTSEAETHVRDAGGLNPFTLRPSTGKRIDILMPVEEGERYRLGSITFSGNKAVANTRALRAQFAQKDGEYFNLTMFCKGLEALRKAYGGQGYINMVANPQPKFDEAKKLVNWVIDIDEGQPFYVSRIEFTGNTITRDKVIRRELLLEEGQVYSSQRWDLSILRLNQLSYFEAAQGRAGLRDAPERGRAHGRPAAEAEGEGQELHRRERRHQRPVGNVHRAELRDQQLPRPGRDAFGQREHRRSVAQPELRIQRALPAQQAYLAGRRGLYPQVRLQPGQGVLDLEQFARRTCRMRSSRC